MPQNATTYNLCRYSILYAFTIVKLREREGQRVDLERSLKCHLWMVDDGWWMVDILSLMLYIKFGCVTFPPPPPPPPPALPPTHQKFNHLPLLN